jgi:uncharacterized membrane protein
MGSKLSARNGLIYALLASNGVSLFLFLVRVLGTNTERYYFLFWNLILAWVPLAAVLLLLKQLKTASWRQPVPILLTFIFLAFLPNSFYIISDLIHLQSTAEVGVLFDTVLFMSIIWNGLAAGMISIYLVHKQLIKRLPADISHLIVGILFFLVSFAIYLGRSLRWNTWDILLNPFGIVFDVSDRVINPLAHPQVFVTSVTFFLLLGSMYVVCWQMAKALTTDKP